MSYIDNHIENVVGAPPRLDLRYVQILNTHRELQEEAESRSMVRKLQKISNSAKRKVQKLTKAVEAMELLKATVQHPRVREKLHYDINHQFILQGSSHVRLRKIMPCLIIRDKNARNILARHLLCPSKMTNKKTLSDLEEKLNKLI